MKKGTYVLDLSTERRGFVVGTGDELLGSWLGPGHVLLDAHGSDPDEGSWWCRIQDVEVIRGEA